MRNPLREDEKLFFMHIPKTAGTSLIAVLDQRYTVDEICPLDRGIKSKYLSIPEEDRRKYKFIRGHFPYSLVDVLEKPRTITFLRDPIKRMLSAINHHKRLEEEGISFFKEYQLSKMTLEDFLDHPDLGTFIANKAVQYLNDITARTKEKNPTLNLSLAKERLETFDFIGFTEHFEDSLSLLSHTFGFYPIQSYQVLQTAPEGGKKESTPPKALDRLAEMNRDEIELYQHGLKIFNERLESMKKEKLTPQEEPPVSLVSNIDYDFRRVDPSRGWHVGELHKVAGIARWSGPDTVSYLDFPLSQEEDLIVRFRVIAAITPQTRNSLVLEVNGEQIPLSRQPDTHGASMFEGRISKSVLAKSAGMTTFAFKIAQTHLPGEFHPENQDVRKLGLCYNQLRIFPADHEGE